MDKALVGGKGPRVSTLTRPARLAKTPGRRRPSGAQRLTAHPAANVPLQPMGPWPVNGALAGEWGPRRSMRPTFSGPYAVFSRGAGYGRQRPPGDLWPGGKTGSLGIPAAALGGRPRLRFRAMTWPSANS